MKCYTTSTNIQYLLFSLIVIFSISSCQKTITKKEDGLKETIQQLNREWESRFNSGDLQGVANMYRDDALLLGPNGYRVTGREEVNAYWTNIKYPIKWELSVIEVSRKLDDILQSDYWKKLKNKPPLWNEDDLKMANPKDLVYQLGHSKLQYKRNTDAQPHTSHVDFVVVWMQGNEGNYRVLVDTYAPNGVPE